MNDQTRKKISETIQRIRPARQCKECRSKIRKHNKSSLCKKCLSKTFEHLSQRERIQKYRDKRRQEIKLEFGGKCSICGYDKCLSALEFHHKDPNNKDPNYQRMKLNGDTQKYYNELRQKCILVCSNCHREIHESIDSI